MWKRLAGFILRNRIALLITVGLLTILMGYMATNVQMSYKQKSVLPSTDSTLINYNHFSKEFGKEGDAIFFTIEDKDFWTITHLEKWMALGNSLQNIDGVDAVASITHNTTVLKKNTKEKKFTIHSIFPKTFENQEQIDSLKQKAMSIPLYNKRLYNTENNSYMMLLTVNSKIIDSKARIPFIKNIERQINEFAQSHDYQIRITGLPYIRVETAQMIKKEMFLFMLLSLLVTAVILYLFFRSFRTMMFSLMVVAIAAVWAIGSMGILGFEITLLTAMLPPLLIVIGIPNCIFMINKYHAEYTTHGNKIMALQRVIMRVGNAIFLTNLTTACGFATFIITSSVILVEFGIVAALNILLLFIFSIILIPCIFSFLPPPKRRHTRHLENKWTNKILDKLIYIVKDHRKWVYTFTILILIVSSIGISMMKTTGFVIDDLPEDSKIMQNLKYFEKNYGGIMPFEVIVDTKKPKGLLQLRTLQDIDKFSNCIQTLPYFSAPLSIVEVAKYMNQAFYNGIPSQYKIPANRTAYQYLLTYANNSTQGKNTDMMKSYVDSTSRQTRLTFYMKDVGTSVIKDLKKDVDSVAKATLPTAKYDLIYTGSGLVFYKGTQYLVRNLMISLLLAIILIASFMAFMFSSKRMVIIALIPNIIPLLVTAALMGYFGIPIKASTILVFSIAFGISVDDTIHYLAKYRQDLTLTKWKIKKAVKMALRETGQSMLYTSIILFFGFLIFSFSEFGGTKALGTLVSLTLLTAMFSNLILLPSLLLSLEKRISNKAFKEPPVEILGEEEENKEEVSLRQ